ncbi:MAG: DEDD exonuclease domain-containing protein [Streptosporangiales bacterium]|nr:DEDD exonuclease domain-containing protein [Streptosporangiales bacterium]MBO0890751.1 DEDD exonuclease domain-containing protein [Acidothermales bacterium]
MGRPHAVQATFDELGTPLREVTFVVVDLETTGGAPADAGITEVGAVKVRGGEVLGEFQSLVDPGHGIPAFIQVLTGITDGMVTTAPPLPGVLSAFLEFARGAVLVAHNAPYDVGFLKGACAVTGRAWPGFTAVDTARLAHGLLTHDEVPDCKLATLARYVKSGTEPCHRALADARATVDVLHALLERLGPIGVQSLEELVTFSSRVTTEQRRKRYLAEPLPSAPGVYVFSDAQGRTLYVGKSRDIRTRVRQYFTAGETRSRMREMVGLAEEVTAIGCATPLEAEVRELRLIAERKPPYNRRSRFPERALWLKLTQEPFPRLSVVRAVRDDDAVYLGPYGSRRSAEHVMSALHEAFRLRQCTARLSPRHPTTACILAEMGRCGAPCDGRQTVAEYAPVADAVRDAMRADARAVERTLRAKIELLSDEQRYEDAAVHRDRLTAYVRSTARTQRLIALTGCAQIVAAHPTKVGGWELTVIRYGRLAAADTVPPRAHPRPYVDALVAAAEAVPQGYGPTPAASAEETECVLRWLETAGTRLVEVTGTWALPAHGAAAARMRLDQAAADGGHALRVLDERRPLRTRHRPSGLRGRA